MRNLSLTAVGILLFFMANTIAQSANSDEPVTGTSSSHGLGNYRCDLVDTYFETDMTEVEIYDCLEQGYSHPVNRNSVRVTYTDGIPSVGQLPKPGDAPAIVSKAP